MGGASGYATSLAGKQAKVANVQDLLSRSEMIFSFPASGIPVTKVQDLRNSLPEGTTMSVVKNKLMARAISGTDFECSSTLLNGANLWVFIEEDIGASIKAFNSFSKDNGMEESHTILAGAIDGEVVDQAQVLAISKMPSKDELYAKIAFAIQAVPTKLARATDATGQKLARAIKLAVADEESSEESS